MSSRVITFARGLTIAKIRAAAPTVLGVCGGVLVLYGISDIMFYVTNTLLSLDLYDVFYAGFVTGSVGMLAISGAAFALYRRSRIQPERAVKLAMYKVSRHPAVIAALGQRIRAGELRAYNRSLGHFHVAANKRLGWVDPRANMLFQVVGDKGEGMVSGEAVKHNGRTVISVLAVDTMAKPGRPSVTILLAGDENKLSAKGGLRGFLQVDRAQYIPQVASVDDDARLAEQEHLPTDTKDEEMMAKEADAQAAAAAASGTK